MSEVLSLLGLFLACALFFSRRSPRSTGPRYSRCPACGALWPVKASRAVNGELRCSYCQQAKP